MNRPCCNRRTWVAHSVVGLAAGGFCGCRTAPLTGRRQLMLIPESDEIAMGQQAFAEFVEAQDNRPGNPQQAAMVQRVADRLASVADRQSYDWETRLIASKEKNAFCLPGGKIVVYEGILPVCRNEAGLAVVMSHEVAHVLARHGGERMSQQAAVNSAKTAVAYALRNREEVSRELWMKAYGMASELGVVLPYSRKHELEADHVGLMLMSKAGYDPTEAPRFWTRFATESGGPKKPEFLSTHPADERRASELERLLPEALAAYQQVSVPLGQGPAILSPELPAGGSTALLPVAG